MLPEQGVRYSLYPLREGERLGLRCGRLRQTSAPAFGSAPWDLNRFWLEFLASCFLAGGEKAIRASRFTDAHKAFILKQGEEGIPLAEIFRRAGISQATHFNWKKKYGGLMPSELLRLKQLEGEKRRLLKLVADLSLDKEMLQGVLKRKL